jgi:uncharacterized protein (DUF2141 family)
MSMTALMLAVAGPALASSPSLGVAAGRCRPTEPGPAIIVTADGLKDRTGSLRVELYPPNDRDFLADDNILVSAGKPFRRVVIPVPATGPVRLCIRVPSAGQYALSLVHNRGNGQTFSLLRDGIGFPGNPRLGLSKPRASAAFVQPGAGITNVSVRMNYRIGLFSFGPLR